MSQTYFHFAVNGKPACGAPIESQPKSAVSQFPQCPSCLAITGGRVR